MPAVNPSQANLFRMAMAVKKGAKVKAASPAVKRIAETLSANKIREFTRTK